MSREHLETQLGELQPNPTDVLISRLEAKNAEVGGVLFSTFGRKDRKALVFPTHSTRKTEDAEINEFLVVIKDGFKLIQIDNLESENGISLEDIDRLILEARKKKSVFHYGRGYSDINGGILNLGPVDITAKSASMYVPPADYSLKRYFDNCRLVDADENRVEEIFRANIERVKATQTTAQKVNELLS